MLANQLQSIGYYKPVILSTIFVTAVRTVHAVLYKLLEMKIVVQMTIFFTTESSIIDNDVSRKC